MMKVILKFYDEAQEAMERGVYLNEILDAGVRDRIARLNLIPEDRLSTFDDIFAEMKDELAGMKAERG